MRARAEWSRRGLAGRGIAAVALVAAALPAYLLVEPSWRPAVVRLACAALVIHGSLRARRWASDALTPLHVSVHDATPPMPSPPELDAQFLRLRDDVVCSIHSRRYFDVVLWPRLLRLGGSELPPPPERRRVMRRLGPSRKMLEGLIAEVERRA
ncbi:MAG TPA: hypothetical protein VGT40_15880 [Methylomirabilota bacterium]|jgi:hypothetical protein|nr:hypothetical protein [Methylomirabilota bacterium]